MKIIEITEDCFGDAMELARKAKEALCGIEDALSKGSMQFRGKHYSDRSNTEHLDYRDYEKFKEFMENYPEFRRGGRMS